MLVLLELLLLWNLLNQLKNEGVELDKKAMGERTSAKTPLVVEVDNEKQKERQQFETDIQTKNLIIYCKIVLRSCTVILISSQLILGAVPTDTSKKLFL